MKTYADERRDEALDAIDSAIADLSKIVVGMCDGADHYTSVYRSQLKKALFDLLTIRESLK